MDRQRRGRSSVANQETRQLKSFKKFNQIRACHCKREHDKQMAARAHCLSW